MRRRYTFPAALIFLRVTVAFGGEPIVPAAILPATTPWNLTSLSQVPDYQWIKSTGPIRSLLYRGPSYRGQPTSVYAVYATPGSLSDDHTLDRNLPAVVLAHGGNGKAWEPWVKLWASRGYAAIAMHLGGSGPDDKRLPDGGPTQNGQNKFRHISRPVKDQWPYHAVANVILAHSLVRSFKEVDRSRTAVIGTSWGGYLACIVAGLDNRLHAAVSVYGCGFLHKNSVWKDMGLFNEMSETNRTKWVQLWDPSQYLPSVKPVMLFVTGARDFAYPLESLTKSYRLVSARKYLCIKPNMRHGDHVGMATREIHAFLEHAFKNAPPLPNLRRARVTDQTIRTELISQTTIVSAELWYTASRGPSKTRKWLSMPVRITKGSVVAPAPPAETKLSFIVVTDERGLVVSSEPFLHAETIADEN